MATTSQTDYFSISDSPKEHPSEDTLNYAPLAFRVAESIANIPSARHGRVMGLYGEWGMGKTTVINFVKHYLDELPRADQPIVVDFDPWWFSGEDVLAHRFFQSIIAVFRRTAVPTVVTEAIANIANVLSEGPKDYSWIGRLINSMLNKPNQATLSDLYSHAAILLRKQSRKVLLIIDDLDRLLPGEMLTVCKLLKLISGLPNIVCLVAMDKKVVTDAVNRFVAGQTLDETRITGGTNAGQINGSLTYKYQSDFGEHFLEKIIQSSYELPVPDRFAMRDLVWKAITEVLGDS